MSKAIEITESELKVLVSESEKPVFIDFWAAWCGPCKMVSPVIEELSNEFSDVSIVKVNVDENPEAAATYGIRTIPTFILLKNNEIVFRHSGAAPKSFFAEKLSSLVK
jgi:thioredoxin 1